VIVGLKNKKATGKMNEAHIDSKGFFVHYDPQLKMATSKSTGAPIYARDTNGSTIPQNKAVNIQSQAHKMIPISNDDGEKV
jgi:pyruvate kinase